MPSQGSSPVRLRVMVRVGIRVRVRMRVGVGVGLRVRVRVRVRVTLRVRHLVSQCSTCLAQLLQFLDLNAPMGGARDRDRDRDRDMGVTSCDFTLHFLYHS